MEVLGSKRTHVVAGASGIAEREVPEDSRKRFCLSPSQVSEVARLTHAVEARVGGAVYIEWECRRGTLFLVSVRRMTA